jgi:hypothetical protein
MIARNWHDQNQSYLLGSLERVRVALYRYVAHMRGEDPGTAEPLPSLPDYQHAGENAPALARLVSLFELTPFERDILMCCAGVELDGNFANLCAQAQGDPQRAFPTLGLALAALPNPHWSAITPLGALRRLRLVEVGSGTALTLSPMRISERVLHYLTGINQLDERLLSLLDLIDPHEHLVSSQLHVSEQMVALWSQPKGGQRPVIQIGGDDLVAKRSVAAVVADRLGMKLYSISANLLPTSPADLDNLAHLWERESTLLNSALLIEADVIEASDAARIQAVAWLVDHMDAAVLISVRERNRALQRTFVTYEVRKPSTSEQRELWRSTLGPEGARLNGEIDNIVAQFNLGAHAIRAAGTEALRYTASTPEAELDRTVWKICRTYARPKMEDLAQRIESTAGWDELVLPEAQRQILRDAAAHVRQRTKVYEQWGFAGRGSRGLGISALFAGPSGTGKTMAAEVLALALDLDLYRIDLSSVVSKYIGETEKNLRLIFDAAEEGGAILLFDEADALFGKRSDVKDSHDRYANIEVSYLLQRMEAYRGLAILTTNLKSALDTAFLRRIRFIVQFPFPDAVQRAEIWRRVFPKSTPVDGIKIDRLAQLNVAGGNIRNIALNAAFLAADANEPVRMQHLLRAARVEYAKMEKSLTDAETAGWL